MPAAAKHVQMGVFEGLTKPKEWLRVLGFRVLGF